VMRKSVTGLINYKLGLMKSLSMEGLKIREKQLFDQNRSIQEYISNRLQNVGARIKKEEQNAGNVNMEAFEKKILEKITRVELTDAQVVHKRLLYSSRIDCVAEFDGVCFRKLIFKYSK
jgi:hypothetical protein